MIVKLVYNSSTNCFIGCSLSRFSYSFSKGRSFTNALTEQPASAATISSFYIFTISVASAFTFSFSFLFILL